MARILIVEDEFMIAAAAEAALEAAGHRVAVAVNGRDALAWMAEQVPDLVITDYMMPRLDGGGLVRAMRSDPRLAGVPVILMTATPIDTIQAKGMDIQMLLVKPVREPALLLAVDTLLDPD